MKTVTGVKGLSNLGTATTKRIRARPPQHGTAHLEMYLLSKEKERLRQELAHLDHRGRRIRERLREITKELVRIGEVAQQEESGEVPEGTGDEAKANPGPLTPRQGHPRWKTMPLEY